MKITPLDLRKQEFKKGMRGYDVHEVDAFLEMVAKEMEETIASMIEHPETIPGIRSSIKSPKASASKKPAPKAAAGSRVDKIKALEAHFNAP